VPSSHLVPIGSFFVISDDVDVLKFPYPLTPELQERRLFSSIIVLEYESKVKKGWE
jgi:hypothetical protein